MRTKCRRLSQDAAEAIPAQCTLGKSQLGNHRRTRALPHSDRRIKPVIGSLYDH